MKDAQDLPLTPDFDPWPVTCDATAVAITGGALAVTWSDGQTSTYHPLLLAENDPAPDVLHPKSRETLLSPVDFPEGLAVASAQIMTHGAIAVT